MTLRKDYFECYGDVLIKCGELFSKIKERSDIYYDIIGEEAPIYNYHLGKTYFVIQQIKNGIKQKFLKVELNTGYIYSPQSKQDSKTKKGNVQMEEGLLDLIDIDGPKVLYKYDGVQKEKQEKN